jgi:hypothetical protein
MRLIDMFSGFDREPTFLCSEEEGGGAGSFDGGNGGSNDANAGAVDMGDISGSVSATGPGPGGPTGGVGGPNDMGGSGATAANAISQGVSINGGPVTNANPSAVMAGGAAVISGVVSAIQGNIARGGLAVVGGVAALVNAGLGASLQQGTTQIGINDPANIGVFGTTSQTVAVSVTGPASLSVDVFSGNDDFNMGVTTSGSVTSFTDFNQTPQWAGGGGNT